MYAQPKFILAKPWWRPRTQAAGLLLVLLWAANSFAGGYYNLGGFWRAPTQPPTSAPAARLISNAYWCGSGSAGMSHDGYQIGTSGVVDGDLLLAFACIDNGTTTLWPSAFGPGFSEISQDTWGNDGETCVAAWKFAQSEPASYSGNYGPGLNSGCAALSLIAVSGVDPATPFNAMQVGYQSGAGAQPVIGSLSGLTTTAPNALVVYASGTDWECGGGSTSFTPPTGFTGLAALGDHGDSTWTWTTLQVAAATQVASGTTGALSGSQTGACPGTAWSAAIALSPVGTSPQLSASRLAISTAPQTLSTTWQCSGALTIEPQNGLGSAVNASLPILINLSGGQAYFSDAACTVAITSTKIALGGSSKTIYFEGSGLGVQTVTASAAGLTSVTQNETITALDPFTWIGGGSCDGNWSTGVCWQGGSPPSSGNTAHFDSACTVNCTATLGANTTIGALALHPGTSGSVILGSYNLSLSGDLTLAGGTFSGGSGVLTVNGNLAVSGGTVALSSGTSTLNQSATISGGSISLGGTVQIQENFRVTGGSVNAAGSTLIFNDSVYANGQNFTVTPGSVAYNNVSFLDSEGAQTLTRTMIGTMTVTGALTLGAPSGSSFQVLVNGTISAQGNITVQHSGIQGTTNIQVAGSGNQLLDASGTTTAFLPALTIASTGGTVTFKGTPIVNSNFTYTSGNVDFTTQNATLAFNDPNGCYPSYTITPGTLTYGNVSFVDANTCYGGSVVTRTISGTLKVNGALSLSANANNSIHSDLNGGAISATGNVAIQNTGYQGTTNLQIAGSGSQLLNASGTTTGFVPALTIASTGGTVTFKGTPMVTGNYAYSSGTVDFTTQNATLAFNDPNGCYPSYTITPGALTYGNVSFVDANTCYGGSTVTRTLSGTMTVNGALVLNAQNGTPKLNGGTISASGNIGAQNLGYPGTTRLLVSGSASQLVDASSSTTAHLPSLEIASTGGTVTFKGNPIIYGNYVYTSGTVDFTTQAATLSFNDDDFSPDSWAITPGLVTYYNVSFLDSGWSKTRTLSAGSTMTVNGTIAMGANAGTVINSGTILAKGNVAVSNAGLGGNTQLTFGGATPATLSVSSGATLPSGNAVVSKPGSTLTLQNNVEFGGNLSTTAGTILMSGHDLKVDGNLDVGAGTAVTKGGGTLISGSQSGTGTIN